MPGLLELATGSGKSLIVAAIAKMDTRKKRQKSALYPAHKRTNFTKF